MTPAAANLTTLKAGGTPTAFTNAPCTKLTANTRYQITDATKRILDPSATILVEKDVLANGTWVTAMGDLGSLDPLFGIFTLTDLGATALVRVSATYIPTHAMIEGTMAEIDETRELLDDTTFGDTARSKMAGHKTFKGNVDQLDPGTTDLDAGAGTLKLKTLLDSGTKFLVEYRPGGTGDYFRGWAIFAGRKASTSPSELVKFGFAFEGAPRDLASAGEGGQAYANFGWGT